jgi:hypothetical protein
MHGARITRPSGRRQGERLPPRAHATESNAPRTAEVPGGDAVSSQAASRKQGPTSSARPRRPPRLPGPAAFLLLTATRVTLLFPTKKKHEFLFFCFL